MATSFKSLQQAQLVLVLGALVCSLNVSAAQLGVDSTDPLVAIDLNRHSIIADIVQGFQAEITRTAPGREVEESAKLHARLSKLRADQLLAVSLASKNGSIANVLDDADSLEKALTGSRTAEQKAIGDANRDLTYTPIAPCRLVDTRGFGAPIQGGAYTPNARRSYAPNGLCSVPTSGVASLMLSVTTQNLTPTSGGYLTILAPGSPVSVANDVFNLGAEWSSLATSVMTGSAGQFDVFVNQATAHVVVDIVGYFGPPAGGSGAGTLGTRIAERTSSTGVGSASCVTGELLVGGGCYCKGSRSTGTNFGVLFNCAPVGLSYSGACFDYLYSSLYGPSPISVSAICMGTKSATGQSADASKEGLPAEVEAALSILRERQIELMRSQ